MSLLGIDVGTTATKAVAFGSDGTPLAAAQREYPLRQPGEGRLELDADEVWGAVVACVREVNTALGTDPVAALAVSSQGEAVTPVDGAGRVLAGSPVTFDGRAAAQAERLEREVGRAELARITGQPPHPMFTVAKLLWWRAHDPGLVRRTWKFLCFGDFVALRLGGEPAIDHSMAARTMAFDVRARRWSPAVLDAAGIPAAQLPTPVPAGTPLGRVAADVAGALGFADRPLIVAGGHDQPCAAFGAGVEEGGEALLSIGTTICLVPVFAQPRQALPARGYPCYPHVVPDRFVTLAGNFTGGSLLRWYRDLFGAEERRRAEETGADVYDLLVAGAADEPSPLLVLPHFAGSGAPANDPRSKGAIVGLSFGTDRGQIVRALLEGVLFEIAVNREVLASIGVTVERVVAVGGGARSDRWLRIAADVLGVPVRRSDRAEAACWGAAKLAASGAGLSPTPDRGRRAVPPAARTMLPRERDSGYYRRRLAVYRSLYGALRPVNHAL